MMHPTTCIAPWRISGRCTWRPSPRW
jgi:hypothetical protein